MKVLIKVLSGLMLLYVGSAWISGYPWPEDVTVVTEFASEVSALQPEEPAPYLALGSEEAFSIPTDSELIFRGRLPSGLGNAELRAGANDIRFLFGNLADQGENGPIRWTEQISTWSAVRKPLLVMVLDHKLRYIINPEIVLENPSGNQAPTLRRLRFRSISADGQVSAPIDVWSWYRRFDLPAGEYLVAVDWADGRFAWNDVNDIFSLRMRVNEQLKFRQGLAFFAENDNNLILLPGRSGDIARIPVSIQPGENRIELSIEDAKGLSQTYEFTINGGVPRSE
jgi:hypothetical protein